MVGGLLPTRQTDYGHLSVRQVLSIPKKGSLLCMSWPYLTPQLSREDAQSFFREGHSTGSGLTALGSLCMLGHSKGPGMSSCCLAL